MSFAAPTALFWLALAVPIVGLYILKVRLRRVPVSTNLFWKQLYDEKPPRSIWQYLRHLLSLLLQLGLLALLVSAVADPFFAWQEQQARRVVLVIDRSASMQAMDVEPSRFGAAIAAAHDIVEGLRARDELAIVLASDPPRVAVGMNGHLPTLRRELDRLRPGEGPTAIEPAVQLGRRLIGDHPRGQIVVFTDGCERSNSDTSPTETPATAAAPTADDNDSAAAQPADNVTVEHRYFGTAADNVGLTQFQVRRSLLDPLGYEILATVRNAGAQLVECRLELELDGLPVDILPLKLAADEVWTRSIEKTSLEGGRLSARLTQLRTQPDGAEISSSPTDENVGPSTPAKTAPTIEQSHAEKVNGLTTDDAAWAILPPRRMQRLLIVTPGNWFLQKVFEANPLVTVDVVDELPQQWPEETLVVLHRLVPPKLPPGDVLVVDPTESCDLWTIGEPLANPIVTEQDQHSPLMTHVRLDNVLMPEARKLKPQVAPNVLAGSLAGDAIYAELPRESGRCLVLTVNLDAGDLAFRTAFPIMVSNALGWFAGTSGELNRAVATGDVATVPLGIEGLSQESVLRLRDPNGTETDLAIPPPTPNSSASSSRSVTIGPLDHVGVYELLAAQPAAAAQGTAPRPPMTPVASLAVNLASAAETDLRPVDLSSAAFSERPLVAAWFARPFWFYLAAAACLLTVAEWWLYQRRFVD